METDEAISTIIAKIKALEPEKSPSIIVYLLMKKYDDRDLMELAYGPDSDSLLQSLCVTAKSLLGLTPSGLSMPMDFYTPINIGAWSPPLSESSPRILENSLLESAVVTPAFISGTLSGSYSNLSSCPSSSSSSSSSSTSCGVDGVVNGSDPFGFDVKNVDTNLHKSSSSANDGFQEGGLVHKTGYPQEEILRMQEEMLKMQEKMLKMQEEILRMEEEMLRMQVAQILPTALFKSASGSLMTIEKDTKFLLQHKKQEEEQIERGNVSSCTNSIQESQINETSSSPKNSDEIHQDESEKENSTPVDDSGKNKAETNGISEREV